MALWKRYQRFTKDGIVWTRWFEVQENAEREKWQLKNKLLNEYKESAEKPED